MKYFLLPLIFLVSCSPLLNVTTTPDAKEKWKQHKKIAIIPFRVTTINDRYKLSAREYMKQQENIKQLSFSIQHNIYAVLQNQYNTSNLSVSVLHPDSTTTLLAQSGITYSNIPEEKSNALCNLLNVDAVIAGYVEFQHPLDLLLLSSTPQSPGNTIEKAIVCVRIYDINKSNPIWFFREQNKAKQYDEYYKRANYVNVDNEQYLIAYMFDKAMKALPYVIKSPLKRPY